MICSLDVSDRGGETCDQTHVLVLNVLEQFELSVGSFAKNRGAEWFHDLLYRDGSTCELVLGRTRGDRAVGRAARWIGWMSAHQTSPKAPFE